MEIYKVNKIDDQELIITGKGQHPLWQEAVVLDRFLSPWHPVSGVDFEFRALYDSQNLYVSFQVPDDSLYLDKTDNSKKSVDNSDRVELFLRSDKRLDPYYCLEIDPLARVQDFRAYPNRQFDKAWNWPKKDITVKSYINSTGFCVELALRLASLKTMGLLHLDGTIEAGIYRAKYHQQPDGHYKPTWITWIDPHTEFPDFHTASSFGILQLDRF